MSFVNYCANCHGINCLTVSNNRGGRVDLFCGICRATRNTNGLKTLSRKRVLRSLGRIELHTQSVIRNYRNLNPALTPKPALLSRVKHARQKILANEADLEDDL